jgi:guanylate kinase
MKQPCLFTISAPSGAGKTSLVKALLQRNPDAAVCVSHATRGMRPGEVDGVDYHFVSVADFEMMADASAFLEHARVFDNYYGTSLAEVERLQAMGRHVILEIDWQGARQVRQKIPDTIPIFILPPSRETLRQRLEGRGTDDPAVIERRMAAADIEMSHYRDARYLVINENFDHALHELDAIITSQGLTTSRQMANYPQLISAIDSLFPGA